MRLWRQYGGLQCVTFSLASYLCLLDCRVLREFSYRIYILEERGELELAVARDRGARDQSHAEPEGAATTCGPRGTETLRLRVRAWGGAPKGALSRSRQQASKRERLGPGGPSVRGA